jgi:hypothetical protein
MKKVKKIKRLGNYIILFIIIIVFIGIIIGFMKPLFYEKCLADEECFKTNLLTCNEALYSSCTLGYCENTQILGELNNQCELRSWTSQDGEVINYDVTCLVDKEISFLTGMFDKSDKKNNKFISPNYICEH